MPAATSSRTTVAKRRSRSSSWIASSRSSAVSSFRCTSALRVTRKGWDSTISMPGKSRSRLWAMTSSSGT